MRSTRQTTWSASTHEQTLCVMGNHAVALPHRGGFTLVELLVVIGIIAVLAALITPAIFQARIAAKNAAIKAEIDMLHMAIMNYKNEFGSFPPGKSNTDPQTGDLLLRSHVEKIMPRADLRPYAWENPSNPYRPSLLNKADLDQFFVNRGSDGDDNDGDGLVDNADADEVDQYVNIDFLTAIPFFLSGYRKDPIKPLRPFNERKSLFEFDSSRINASSGGYHPAGKPEAPYIYIPSSQYAATGSLAEIDPKTNDYYNSGTFQILCAGQDEVFLNEDKNSNGVLDPGEDTNGNDVLDQSDDDLSNFWKGTRGDQ